jgi:hypothetical protein
MTRGQIASIVTALGDILAVLKAADPADKAEIYSQLGPRLTYQPGQRLVRAEAHLDQTPHWDFDSVRGAIAPKSQCVGAGEFAVGACAYPPLKTAIFVDRLARDCAPNG